MKNQTHAIDVQKREIQIQIENSFRRLHWEHDNRSQ